MQPVSERDALTAETSVLTPLRAAVALGLGLLLLASFGSQPLRADIRTTKHNLVDRIGLDRTTVDEREVCVFCHFPAIVDQSGNFVARAASSVPPEWQQTVADDYLFAIYDDLGRAGLDGAATVGSQSVACLACHDSNQAFMAAGGSMDHPFGVPYRGIRASQAEVDAALQVVRRAGTPLREGIYMADGMSDDYRPAFEAVVEQRRIFWVSTVGNSLRRAKTDLPLYSRAHMGVADDIPFIECTSCHDPHTSNELFLRVSNQANQLCLTCHVK